MSIIVIYNDPIATVLEVVERLYPGTEACVHYDTSIPVAHKRLGYTDFNESPPAVCLAYAMPLARVPGVLSHELAHVVAGPTDPPHGEAWATVFRRIFVEWFTSMMGTPPSEEDMAYVDEEIASHCNDDTIEKTKGDGWRDGGGEEDEESENDEKEEEGGGSVRIPVSEIEFYDGGNTMWIHSPLGATVLRIKTRGRITTEQCTLNPVSHADLVVEKDIRMCLSVPDWRRTMGPDANG